MFSGELNFIPAEIVALYLFTILVANTTDDMIYVDLLLNPERFTGYSGDSAHRIWNSIYQENCFR